MKIWGVNVDTDLDLVNNGTENDDKNIMTQMKFKLFICRKFDSKSINFISYYFLKHFCCIHWNELSFCHCKIIKKHSVIHLWSLLILCLFLWHLFFSFFAIREKKRRYKSYKCIFLFQVFSIKERRKKNIWKEKRWFVVWLLFEQKYFCSFDYDFISNSRITGFRWDGNEEQIGKLLGNKI